MYDLTFHDEDHRYVVDGIERPFITQILSAVRVQRKDGSIGQMFNYDFLSDRKGQDAKDRGTWIADLAATRIEHGVPFPPAVLEALEAEAPQWFKFFPPFDRWLVRAMASGFQPLLVEKPLYSPRYRFAGRPDLVCILNGKRPSVVELKTGVAPKETSIQTAAQEILLHEQDDYPHKGEIHDRYALQIPSDGSEAQLIPHRDGSRDRADFLAMLHVWHIFHEGR